LEEEVHKVDKKKNLWILARKELTHHQTHNAGTAADFQYGICCLVLLHAAKGGMESSLEELAMLSIGWD